MPLRAMCLTIGILMLLAPTPDVNAARLSAEHRAVLILHHYLGMPVAEIADVLGIPAGTVCSRWVA